MKISSKFKSIQSSIFCAVSILVLSAVLVVTVVSLRYTNSSIYENSVMYTQTIIKQLNQNIDSYISYMDNIASVIAQSGDAYKYLYSEKGYGATKDENYSEYRQRLVEQFKTILKGRADIRNIGIVREDKNSPSLFDNGLSVRNTYVDLNTQPWYADAVGKYDRYNLTSSHVQNVIKGERPWVITLSRGIRNYIGTEAEDGVVFLDLNYSAISELCAQSSMGDKGYVFILDQNGNIVYHPQQQQLYNELQTENISLVMNAKSDIVTVGKGDDEKIYALSHSDITGWTIVGCMNMSELLRNSRQTRSIYVLVAVGLIIVALLISSLIARNITLPIQKLRDSMKSVQKGNFDIEDIEVISDNEIGSLTRSFNVMTHRIRELMEQNVKEQEQKRKISCQTPGWNGENDRKRNFMCYRRSIMAELSIAIADDNRQTLNLLGEILEKEDGIHVVGKADNGEDAYNMIVRTNPDIVLMDVIMPRLGKKVCGHAPVHPTQRCAAT